VSDERVLPWDAVIMPINDALRLHTTPEQLRHLYQLVQEQAAPEVILEIISKYIELRELLNHT